MKITPEFINSYKKDAEFFVETGTYMGDTTYNASLCGFNEVHTIELSSLYHNAAKDRFSKNLNVKLHKGSSANILGDVIDNIDSKIIFWLDGHYSGGDTATDIKYCPLEEELDWIKSHRRNDHIIMIDDIRLSGTEWIISLDVIKSKLKEINSNYEFILIDTDLGKDDILIATIN